MDLLSATQLWVCSLNQLSASFNTLEAKLIFTQEERKGVVTFKGLETNPEPSLWFYIVHFVTCMVLHVILITTWLLFPCTFLQLPLTQLHVQTRLVPQQFFATSTEILGGGAGGEIRRVKQ